MPNRYDAAVSTATATHQSASLESERPLEDVLASSVDPTELPRLVERLAELSDAGVRWWAPKLLELLDSPLADQRLRGALAHVVLRAGYPWALQLDPDDVERGKALQPKQPSPHRRRTFAVGAIAAVVVASATASFFQRTTTPPSLVPESGLAAETAAKVASLRAQGFPRRAQVLAEACAVVADTPIGCLRQLEDLARETANQSNDPFDRHRSAALGRLASRPNNETIRAHARDLYLFESDIALDATYFAPSVESVRKRLLDFVLYAQTLEDGGDLGRLGSEAASCSLRQGQFGIVCRDYLDHARRHLEITTPSPLAELTPRTKDIAHLRRMIDAARQGRLDDVIAEGQQCSDSNSSDADTCRRLLIDAYEHRAAAYANVDERRADRDAAERIRSTLEKVSRF